MSARKYDSTVARIAGNIASGLAAKFVMVNVTSYGGESHRLVFPPELVRSIVAEARSIVKEVELTEPEPGPK